jgi:small subunit ribosomal protein S2
MPAVDPRGAPAAYVPDEQHVVSMRDLLQGGVHFGHQTRRWNPKMKQYIFAERGGIYIIDLMQTTQLIDEAYGFIRDLIGHGGSVLFVGTKKQCQEAIKEQAQRVGMPYVSNRWLGGLLTNYATINGRIRALHEMREQLADGTLDKMPAREAIRAKGELAKLENNLGGVAVMDRLPSAVFVVDPHKEQIVVRETRKLGIPLIGLVDTNCDPDEIDYVIPGNDDAIRSCALIIRVLADAVEAGRQLVTERDIRGQVDTPAGASAQPTAAQAEPGDGRRRPSDRGRGDRRGGPGGDRRGGGRGRAGGPGGQRQVSLGEPPIGRQPRSAASRERQQAAATAKEEAKAEAQVTEAPAVDAPVATEPAAAPEAPETKATPAKDEGAAKADAPKADAKKAEAPNADAPKADAKKADAAPEKSDDKTAAPAEKAAEAADETKAEE